MTRPANILFVHQNFPGQFPHIADALRARGHRLAAIGSGTAKNRPGVDVRRWSNSRGSTPDIYPPATRAEADLIRAEAAARVALQLKADGFVPDLIIGHPGWGETLHLRDIFPQARQILFGEYFYRSEGGDVGFDPEFQERSFAADMRTTAKNAVMALCYTQADRIVCPTPFQASTFPAIFQSRITVQHEGLDLSRARRNPKARLKLPNGRWIEASTPTITFINRNFERLRGFHVFMRALPAFLDACPEAQVVLIGSEGQGYGGAHPSGKPWKQVMLEELGGRLDVSRVHFLGRVEHQVMIDAMSISWGHVYYTYPFILSWSLVEAMACECLILASDTAPVRDAIEDGVNGVLNDFFDVDALSGAMVAAVREPARFAQMREVARESAGGRFDQRVTGVPAWLDLVGKLINDTEAH